MPKTFGRVLNDSLVLSRELNRNPRDSLIPSLASQKLLLFKTEMRGEISSCIIEFYRMRCQKLDISSDKTQ
jgi:hypothetical protein